VVAIFAGNLAAGRHSTINGTGEQTRDYVYVRDVARANVLESEDGVPSGAYNIGTGVKTSVNRLYELLREILQQGPSAGARTGEARRAAP
jgi:UDP-glucose 4-epimerase